MPVCMAATPESDRFWPIKFVIRVAGVFPVAGWKVAVPRCCKPRVSVTVPLSECIEATPVWVPAGPPTAPMIWADIGTVPAVT